MTFAFGLEKARELGERGGFARTLQAHQHYLDGRPDLEIELARLPAHHLAQFGRDELDQVLFGRERAQHLLAERLLLDVIDEVADHADIYVGLEQREPDLAERFFDIALGDTALALKLFENPSSRSLSVSNMIWS